MFDDIEDFEEETEVDEESEVIHETEYIYLESEADYTEITEAMETAALSNQEYWDKNMQSIENAMAIQIVCMAAVLGAVIASMLINLFSRR